MYRNSEFRCDVYLKIENSCRRSVDPDPFRRGRDRLEPEEKSWPEFCVVSRWLGTEGPDPEHHFHPLLTSLRPASSHNSNARHYCVHFTDREMKCRDQVTNIKKAASKHAKAQTVFHRSFRKRVCKMCEDHGLSPPGLRGWNHLLSCAGKSGFTPSAAAAPSATPNLGLCSSR